VTHVPIEIASRYAKEDLASSTFLALMERAGVKAHEAEQWISATAASPVVAAALAVPSGSPLLKIERVMRGPLRQPVQMIEACYRPDRFQYHVRSRRRSGDDASWSHEG
jgi:GntR family transcriptional regulator